MSVSKWVLNAAMIACLVGVLGCPAEQEPNVENTPQPGTTTRSEDTPKTDKLPDSKEYSQETLKERYTELNQNIQNLEGKAAEISSESKEEYNQMMRSLQRQNTVVKERLDALGASASEGWEQLKASTEEALRNLQSAYDKMAARFP